MRDTDIYDDRYRVPEQPPPACREPIREPTTGAVTPRDLRAADTGSKHATPGVDALETALRNRGERA